MSVTREIPLGKNSDYPQRYNAKLLFPVARQLKRDELGIDSRQLPFCGEDIWNGYELSWLNSKGKPVVALARFSFPCTSPFLVESKSFKLYLNSLNQCRFDSWHQVQKRLCHDLTAVCGGSAMVTLYNIDDDSWHIGKLNGTCLDNLDIAVDNYQLNNKLLHGCSDSSTVVSEQLYSHLLKSNCLITGQPDWASIWIEYSGAKIDHECLLAYLISFRQHNEFHEQCVERIYTDLMRHCQPDKLTVYARYTRRGGLDINPWRSNCTPEAAHIRLARQ